MGLREDLVSICGGGAVHANQPRFRVTPESTGEVAGVLAATASHGARVVIRGGGTKAHWGPPPGEADLLLDLSRLTGLAGHPDGRGDIADGMAALTDRIVRDDEGEERVGVRAGTPVTALQRALGAVGRRLSLDVPLDQATVGGTVATDTAGPLRLTYGTPRDLVAGMVGVLVDGAVFSVGQRDAPPGGLDPGELDGRELGDVLVGSYGTLAVLTEIWLRVDPVPERRVWVTRTVASPHEVRAANRALLGSGLNPAALEVNCPYARSSPPDLLAVLVEGDADEADARADAVRRLLGGDARTGGPPAWWGRHPFGPSDAALEITTPPGGLFSIATALSDVAGDLPLRVRCSPGIPLMHVGVPPQVGADRFGHLVETLHDCVTGREGSFQVLYAPPEWLPGLRPEQQLPDVTLLRRLKRYLDPDGRLTPGRLPAPVAPATPGVSRSLI